MDSDYEDPANEKEVVKAFNVAFANEVDMPILSFVPPQYPNNYVTRGEI